MGNNSGWSDQFSTYIGIRCGASGPFCATHLLEELHLDLAVALVHGDSILEVIAFCVALCARGHVRRGRLSLQDSAVALWCRLRVCGRLHRVGF